MTCHCNGFVTRVTRWVPQLEQVLFTLPEHLGSPTVFSVVLVARSLVFCLVFCRSLFVLFLLVIVVCPSTDLRLLVTPLISSNLSCTLTLNMQYLRINNMAILDWVALGLVVTLKIK